MAEVKYSKRKMIRDEVRGRKGLDCIVPCSLGFYSKRNRKPRVLYCFILFLYTGNDTT